MHFAGPNLQVDAVQRPRPRELLDQFLDLEDDCGIDRAETGPARCGGALASRAEIATSPMGMALPA
jgi:hypothetical protein